MTTRWLVIYNRAQNDDSQESFSVCSKACTFQFLRAVMTLKVFMDFFGLSVCLWLTLMSSLLYRCVNYTSAVLVPDVRKLYIKHFQSLMFPPHTVPYSAACDSLKRDANDDDTLGFVTQNS